MEGFLYKHSNLRRDSIKIDSDGNSWSTIEKDLEYDFFTFFFVHQYIMRF